MLTAFAIPEALYYYLNPLHIWLVLGIVAQMSLLELILRGRSRRRGEAAKGSSLPILAILVISLFLVVFLYAWGRGENVFSYYLEYYRVIFGAGVGI